MKFTEKLKEFYSPRWREDGEGFVFESLPAIIEVLEAAEEIRVLWKIDDYRRLPRALDALDALVEEPKP